MSAKRRIKVVISATWWSADRIASFVGLGRRRAGALTVLYYHAVRSSDSRAFEDQLDAIRAYADVVGPDYLGGPSGRPKIAITFDDAFVSVIDHALPSLEARKMPSTIFIPTQCLGATPSWMMEHGATDREEFVASPDRVRALADRKVRLGSHSQTHPKLTALDPGAANREIFGSKADLETLIDKPVDMFAFPYGDYNETVVETARSAGYRFVFSTQPGLIDPGDLRILRSRIAVDPSDSQLEFWLKLRGGYDWMPAASRLKKRLFSKRW